MKQWLIGGLIVLVCIGGGYLLGRNSVEIETTTEYITVTDTTVVPGLLFKVDSLKGIIGKFKPLDVSSLKHYAEFWFREAKRLKDSLDNEGAIEFPVASLDTIMTTAQGDSGRLSISYSPFENLFRDISLSISPRIIYQTKTYPITVERDVSIPFIKGIFIGASTFTEFERLGTFSNKSINFGTTLQTKEVMFDVSAKYLTSPKIFGLDISGKWYILRNK
jgi:hypothetical protein